MKLLITGSNGFVAGSVLSQVPKQWEIHGVARSESPASTSGTRGIHPVHHHTFDLLDHEKLSGLVHLVKPDVVIHAAAIANIDFCENHPSQAEAMNIGVTEQLANLCRETGAKLIFCSTDTVFEGKKGHYSESDLPVPINVYARTKVEAEQRVLGASPKNIVARLSLVMGLPVIGRGNSFLAEILEKFKKAESVRFPENEIRTPVDVITLGAALNELAMSSFVGIIHLAGNTRINRYEMARQIARTTGFSPDLVLPVDSNSLPGRAPRPNDASLNNSKARQILKTPMLTLEEGLSLTLHGRDRIEASNQR